MLPYPHQSCLCFWDFPRAASGGGVGGDRGQRLPPTSSFHPRPRNLGPQAWLDTISGLEANP